jgi:putative MATE family efflux protein
MILAVLLSFAMAAAGVTWAGDILRLMGAEPEVIRDGAVFGRILLGGNTVILLLFLVNGIFRGAGDAAMAMRSLWLASGMNILLCPVFIHQFGLKGAAIATVCGRGAGVLYQGYHLFRGSGTLRFRRAHFQPDPRILQSLATLSWPATFQYLIGSGSWIVVTRLVAETGGTIASAGYQIAFRCFAFFILPAWGLSNAAATLVGQNLGARRPERAEESVIITNKFSAGLMIFVTLALMVPAQALISVFTADPQVLSRGAEALRVIASGFVFYGVAMVLSQALNGAGDTKTPTRFNLVCFWIFQLPFAYGLAQGLRWGPIGAVTAVPVSQALFAGIAWRYFRQGRWKSVQV